MPAKRRSLPSRLGMSCRRSRPPAWAIPSIRKTPGSTGRPGKCPRKTGSQIVTFLMATMRFFGSISSTRSTSRIG
jgi:hypothetical protein